MFDITISEFKKASEGSVFVKKNGKLVAVSKEEFLKELGPIKSDINKTRDDQKALNNMLKYFDLFSKPHFQLVFNAFKLEVLGGLIDVVDESILKLDEEVAKGHISVKDALSKHEFLTNRFRDLFIDNKKELKGFWEI